MRLRCLTCLLALALALAGACEPGGGSSSPKPAAPVAMTPPAASDFCVAIRADYFRQEQYYSLVGSAGGGALNDPWIRVMLAQYKLDYPKCFF